MSLHVRSFYSFLSFLFFLLFAAPLIAMQGGLTLYTPHTKIEVAPGETIDYQIDIINKSAGVRHADLSVKGLPEDWRYELKSGTFKIGQVSVLGGERKNATLKVEVPLKVDKGVYRFRLETSGGSTLPLTVEVSEQGTLSTELSSSQPNMQGSSGSTFTFNSTLKNRTGDDQVYSLRADPPRGWNVVFKVGGKAVSSIPVEAGANKELMIDVDAPSDVQAGTYKIPVVTSTLQSSSKMELEVVITGSYKVELTTPTGLLSSKAVAGNERKIELLVKNTGASPLSGVEVSGAAPVNWELTFEPKKISVIEPGKSETVIATLKPDRKALAGDYVVNIDAKTSDTSSRVALRVAVEASFLSGFLGVLIILAALGSVYYLFRKYGRR